MNKDKAEEIICTFCDSEDNWVGTDIYGYKFEIEIWEFSQLLFDKTNICLTGNFVYSLKKLPKENAAVYFIK